MKSKLLLCILLLIVFACKKADSSYNEDETTVNTYEESTDAYPDGTYCADIDYYNPDTGTRSTYSLNVEVESHEVTVIQWSNGGWLDSTHFNSEELDGSGYCSFTTFDGNQYDVQITGSECIATDESVVSGNEYYEKQKITCPECGGTKYKYDDVCDNCKRKAQDVADHTCKRCGQQDSFMFSSDDLCSDCERADKEKEREEEERARRNSEEEE